MPRQEGYVIENPAIIREHNTSRLRYRRMRSDRMFPITNTFTIGNRRCTKQNQPKVESGRLSLGRRVADLWNCLPLAHGR